MGNGRRTLFASGTGFRREISWDGDAVRGRLADHDWGVRQERHAAAGVQPRFWFIPIVIIAVIIVLATPTEVNPVPAPEDPDLVGAAGEMKVEVKKLEIAVE